MTASKTTRRRALAGGVAIAAVAATPGEATMTSDEWSGITFRCFDLGDKSGIPALTSRERQARGPQPGEVIVRMRAASLNYRDTLLVAGLYSAQQPGSRIPLSDGAGDIVAVGDGVSGFAVGDRVTAPHFVNWLAGDYDPSVFANDIGISADGWASEYVWLPASSLIRLPDDMSYVDAAALGVAAITAWRVLETLGNIKSGDVVLTLGTGGVSIMALQIASMNGARVAITSSSDEKLALAKRLGADITVNYRKEPDWHDAVREATGGHGADIVCETVGVATLAQSIKASAPNARIGLLGVLEEAPKAMPDLLPLLIGNIVVQGITSGSRQMHAELLRAVTANGMSPYVDKVFDFDDTREAFQYLADAGHVGKVLIRNDA